MKFCCDNIVKLGCFDSCQQSFNTGLTADQTGVWKIGAEFNGVVIRFAIEVLQGEKIIIPNKLNEEYTHLLEIFRPDNTLFQNTCFTLQTYPCRYADYNLPNTNHVYIPQVQVTVIQEVQYDEWDTIIW